MFSRASEKMSKGRVFQAVVSKKKFEKFQKLGKKHKQMNRRFKRVVNKNGKEQGSYVDIQKHGLGFQIPSAKAENCE